MTDKTKTLEPGINLPCFTHTPENPDLFAYWIEADGTGLIFTPYGEQRREFDGYRHAVAVPAWTKRSDPGYIQLRKGDRIKVFASGSNELTVEMLRPEDQVGGWMKAVFTDQPVVIFHRSIPAEVLKANYES